MSKDHKGPDGEGLFPTRLVIPVTNFTSTFSKMGYMGIKKLVDNNLVNYSKCTIVSSLHLKIRLKPLGLKEKDITVMLLDLNN